MLRRFWHWVDSRVMHLFLGGLLAIEAEKERERLEDDDA